jgi:ABC-type amino acid transport substrate-binding protein
VTGSDVLSAMRVERRADFVLLPRLVPPDATPTSGARLQGIRARRTLRACYLSDGLPYAFINGSGELVGFDIALMHRLAIELGVRLEFLPFARPALDRGEGAPELLRQGYCDVIIGGMAVTTGRAGAMQLSSPYFEETLGFVVPDGDRLRFESWDTIRAAGALRIDVPDVPYYLERLRGLLPRARLETVATVDALFEPQADGAAAFAIPAERGSAWTLRYPRFSVVVPGPDPIRVPLAFAVARAEPDLATFLNTWIDLKRRDGTIDELYRYWILGQDPAPDTPRWSIIRDVLHWVE